jgi:hypothetical protein
MICRLVLALAGALAFAGFPALAQNSGNIPPQTVLGNPSPTAKQPAKPVPFSTLTAAPPSYMGPPGSTRTNNFIINNIPNTTEITTMTALTHSNVGGFAITGGADMALCTTSAPCDTFGVGGIALQDSANVTHSAYGVFGQTRAYPGSRGPAQANEFDIINVGPSALTPLGISPYGFRSGSGSELINTQIACGDPSITNGDCSYGIGILNNAGGGAAPGGHFLVGINFAANAILGASGVDTDTTPVPAIQLGRMQAIDFWSLGPGNANPTSPAAQIYASTTLAGGLTSMNLNFASQGLVVEDTYSRSKNVVIDLFNNATSYLQFTAGTVAIPPAIAVNGTDVNIPLQLSVPGTGSFNFYNGGGSTPLFEIAGAGQIRLPTFNTPASSSAACNTGTIEADTSYIYVCVGTNTWKRTALSAF